MSRMKSKISLVLNSDNNNGNQTIFNEKEEESSDNDVIYCGTFNKDIQQVSTSLKTMKIRQFFKALNGELEKNSNNEDFKGNVKYEEEANFEIQLKSVKKLNTNKSNGKAEIKNEAEASFVINLDEIEDTNPNFQMSSNPTKIRECRVILKDYKYEIEPKQIKIYKNLFSNNNLKPGKVKKNICEFCGIKFSALPEHLRYSHFDKIKNSLIKCKFCKKMFFQKGTLKGI